MGTRRLVISFFGLLLAIGCHSVIKQPELIDPIYNDILAEISKNQGEIATTIEQVEAEKKLLIKAKPQSGEYSYHKKKIFNIENFLTKQKQRGLYLDILLQQRKKEARLSYAEAYSKAAQWPDPGDFQLYLKQKKVTLIPTTLSYLGADKKDKGRSPAESKAEASESPKHE